MQARITKAMPAAVRAAPALNPPETAARRGAAPGEATQAPNCARRGRVQKTLWPPAPGSKRLQERFGSALLCVRYRHDPAGLRRFTTVELVVDIAPTPRARQRVTAQGLFPLAVGKHEQELRATLKRNGAKWSAHERQWYLAGEVIRRLALEDRICIDRHPKSLRNRPSPPDNPTHDHS